MTVGSGGHARLILQASGPTGQLIAIDCDAQALELARQQLAEFGQRVQFFQRRYSELPDVLADTEVEQVDGILIDTGISRDQMLDLERGFSFHSHDLLDMRMDNYTE